MEKRDENKWQKASKIVGVIDKCVTFNCLKILPDGTCLAFCDPSYQWRGGRTCYGYCSSTHELDNIITLELQEMQDEITPSQGVETKRCFKNVI